MISVDVRDLKNQLSRFLQPVKNGERLIIPEHNKVIVELCAPWNEPKETSVAQALARLGASGKVTLATPSEASAALTPASSAVDWKTAYSKARKDRS